jgi:hypothetical protein
MDATQSRLLDEVRGLVAARALVDDALTDSIRRCRDAGVGGWSLASSLGVHRSTLYRRHLKETAPEE